MPFQVSPIKFLNTKTGFFKEEYCDAFCPEKCSSNYWKIYDYTKTKSWEGNNVIEVNCGTSSIKKFQCIYI